MPLTDSPLAPRTSILVAYFASALLMQSAARTAYAQPSRATDTSGRSAAPPIQDNSFLIEESYNQAAGVVQHIFNYLREEKGTGSTFLFTQEWPAPGVRHQLSYSVPLERADATTGTGFGDLHLNYRYQLVGDGDAVVAIAPRLTAILPTGDYRRGRGTGTLGGEAWLPISVVLASQLVAHANAGITLTPHAKDSDGARATTRDWTAAGSMVWLAHPRFNFLLEVLYQETQDVVGPGATDRSDHLTISPGIRWAYNFASGLQIVPGLAIPFGAGPSRGERSVFVYLSFEHPFTRRRLEKQSPG